MPDWIPIDQLSQWGIILWSWLELNLLSYNGLAQLVGVLLGALMASVMSRRLRGVAADNLAENEFYKNWSPLLEPVLLPIIWFTIQVLLIAAWLQLDESYYFIRLTANLLGAWILIRIASTLIRNRELARLFATAAWTLAAINILGLFNATVVFLDSLAFSLGDFRLSLWSLAIGVLTLIGFIWLAIALSNFVERQLKRSEALTPSLQVLFGKLLKIGLITIAVIIGLTSAGLDLTAFAVFGGAIGVGIGFGLQKVVSNLISGVILLLDQSIKPGDVIEIGTTYGRINSLAARYTSVVTRSGQEFLIPNEDMITQQVINWTHTDSFVRRSIPINISYRSDLHKAMELAVLSAQSIDRVLDRPAPFCLLKGFGDNGVDLELRMWISDPQNGVSNVASEVLLNIWDKYHAEEIEFPFPQRDVHLYPMEPPEKKEKQADPTGEG